MLNFIDKINTKKLIYALLFVILMWLIMSFISMRLAYSPLFDWWNQYDGKSYSNVLDIYTLAAVNFSTIQFYIRKIFFTPPLNQMTIDGYRFIIGRIFPYLRVVINNKQEGIVIPKGLCETVMLSTADNDQLFDEWFYYGTHRPLKEGNELNYTQFSVSGEYYYKLDSSKNPDGKYGVYPISTSNTEGWAGLILEWLNGEASTELNYRSLKWCFVLDDKGLLQLKFKGTTDPYEFWFQNNTGRGDNFLARTGLLPDSPLVIYFFNRQYSTGGMVVDPQAFQNLLAPKGSVAGGWVGFVNGMGNVSTDQLYNYVDTSTEFIAPLPPRPPCENDTGGAWLAAGTTLVSSLIAVAFVVGAGPAAIGAVIALSAGAAALNGVQTYRNSCPI